MEPKRYVSAFRLSGNQALTIELCCSKLNVRRITNQPNYQCEGIANSLTTAEEEDEDNMEEIDTENIVPEQTRRKQINWAEAEQKLKAEGEDMDDDDEDDEDFEDPDTGDRMKD